MKKLRSGEVNSYPLVIKWTKLIFEKADLRIFKYTKSDFLPIVPVGEI